MIASAGGYVLRCACGRTTSLPYWPIVFVVRCSCGAHFVIRSPKD